MFAYPCPSCSQRLLAPAERAGVKTVCPKCLNPLTVPHPDDAFGDPPFGPAVDDPAGCDTGAFTPPPASAVETPSPANTAFPDIEIPELDLSGVDVREAATATLEPARVDTSALLSALADPPARPARPTAAATAPPAQTRPARREREGQGVLNPTGQFAVDAMAELSATLSMRMAPPPDPTSDRTAALVSWLFALTVGLVAWACGVFVGDGWFAYTALVGAAMVAFGLLWRAYLSGRGGNAAAGLATLVPPVGVVQLFRPVGQYGLRPLRFVAAGLALLGLYVAGPPARARVNAAFGPPTGSAAPSETVQTPERMSEKTDRETTKKALLQRGPDAEPAALLLLASPSEPTVLMACEVLEQVGGERAAAELRKLADDAKTRAVRVEAAAAVEAIAKRLGGVK